MGGLVRCAALLASGAVVVLALASCDGGGGVPASDEDQIRQAIQNLFDYSKRERWSDIYDLHSQEFRDRCSRDEFIGRALQESTTELPKELINEIESVGVENIQVEGDTASANIVTMWSATSSLLELPPEKHVEGAYFVKEDEKWHLVPQPGTSGCDTTSSQDVPPIPPE